MKKINTRLIAGAAIFTAIEIVLQIIGNYVSLGPISLNLALIPITLGAIIYGPIVGAWLGLVNGCIVLSAPSTISLFMGMSVGGTILTCLTKSTIAGLVAGFLYLPFKKNYKLVGSIIVSIVVPTINSLFFAMFALIFFRSWLEQGAAQHGDIYTFLFLFAIGWNYIFELATTGVVVPILNKTIPDRLLYGNR